MARRKKKTRALRHLVRLEGEKLRGWQGRFYPDGAPRRGRKKYRSRYFSDGAHGGRGKAWLKALRWVNGQRRRGRSRGKRAA